MVINRDIVFEPSGTEVAELFWNLDSEEQAVFFNQLHELAGHKLCMQMQWVTDSELLTEIGRLAMKIIGEYSSKEFEENQCTK